MRNKLKIIPLGGIDEIGKNLTVVEYGKHIVIIDCGLAFPSEEMLGIDLVIPDMSYLVENKDKIKALVVTHGHEDHIGAIPYLLEQVDVPIYGTRLTVELIRSKLEEHRIKDAKLNIVKPRDVVNIGCFSVEFIKVSHSIQGSVGLGIKTPVGTIVHSGDFKVDYTPVDGEVVDLARFAALGEQGVLALMADSTNVEHRGYTMSEKSVGGNLDELFKNAKGRVIVSTFASNIHRVQQIINLAESYGRKVCFTGRSMIRVSSVASSINELNAKDGTIIDINQIKKYSDDMLTIITTGSQGEPMSGLVRMATHGHAHVAIKKGDTVIISASPIPGNEKFVYRVINQLFKRGAEVIYNAIEEIHTSGHACQEELKLLHTLVKPKYFIPVHGEYRHLKMHGQLAQSLGMPEKNIVIPELGRSYVLLKNKIVESEKVSAGAIMVDGLGIGDVGNVVLRDRKHLSQDGLVIVVLTISMEDGSVLAGPDLISRGFVYVKEAEELMEELKELIQKIIDETPHNEMMDWAPLKSKIRSTLRRYLYEKTRRNPMILPVFMEI